MRTVFFPCLRPYIYALSKKSAAKYAVDLILWLSVAPLAFCVRLEGISLQYGREILLWTLAGLPLKACAIYVTDLYGYSWHKVGVYDFSALIRATGSVTALLFAAALIGVGELMIPRSVPLIEGMLALLALSAVRLVARLSYEQRSARKMRDDTLNVLIVGAGEAGALLAREMLRDPTTERVPLGFLDDDPAKQLRTFGGVRVLGTI